MPAPLRTALRCPFHSLGVLALLLFAAAALPGQEVSETMPLADRALVLDLARSGDRWIAVGERGHILLSDDQGRDWRQVAVPSRALLTAVAFDGSGRNGCAVGHDNTLLLSRDGGLNWKWTPVDGPYDVLFLDAFWLDADTAFAVGAYGEFWETRDAGASWNRRAITEEELHLNAIARADDGTLFIAGESGLLLRSGDRGNTWDPVDTPYFGSYHGLFTVGSREVYLFGMRGHIFYSPDLGENWIEKSGDSKVFLSDGLGDASGNLLITGQGGTLFTSGPEVSGFTLHLRPEYDKISAVGRTRDGALLLAGNRGMHRIEPAEARRLFQQPDND